LSKLLLLKAGHATFLQLQTLQPFRWVDNIPKIRIGIDFPVKGRKVDKILGMGGAIRCYYLTPD
jgi:hypothetical protein